MTTKSLGTRFLYSAVSTFDRSEMPRARLLQIAFVLVLSVIPLKASPGPPLTNEGQFRLPFVKGF
ncbi:MAG: hypothetical protein WBD99_12895 [Thermodesulfobacteriota bacterium]